MGTAIPNLRSSDLVNWEQVGSVFMIAPKWAWATFGRRKSEYKAVSHLLRGRKRGGPLRVAVASADNPAGPYRDHGPLVANRPARRSRASHRRNGKRFLIWKEDGNAGVNRILWA